MAANFCYSVSLPAQRSRRRHSSAQDTQISTARRGDGPAAAAMRKGHMILAFLAAIFSASLSDAQYPASSQAGRPPGRE